MAPAAPGGGGIDVTPDDDLQITHEQWRRRWIDEGMRWRDTGVSDPPAGWDSRAQLAALDSV